MGIDNRDVMPPFVPFGRGEDGIFALCVQRCYPNALTVHLPFAMAHEPEEARSYPSGAMAQGLARTKFGTIVESAIHHLVPRSTASDPSRNLRAMGRALQALGSAPLPEFHAQVRWACWTTLGAQVARLEASLDEHPDGPAYWRADVESQIRHAREVLLRPDYPASDELGGLAADQAAIRKFGELMQCWPDVVAACRDLRRRGVPIGVSLGSR